MLIHRKQFLTDDDELVMNLIMRLHQHGDMLCVGRPVAVTFWQGRSASWTLWGRTPGIRRVYGVLHGAPVFLIKIIVKSAVG